MFGKRPDPRDAVIETLLRQNADLLDRLQEMIGQIHIHQVEANKSRLELERPRDFKLYTSEDEDDATAMATRDDGTVDEAMLAQILAQANFSNTEIEIA